jgi:glucokinase
MRAVRLMSPSTAQPPTASAADGDRWGDASPRQHPDAGGRSHAGGAPGPWLVADIGGTNARFGWVAAAQTTESAPQSGMARAPHLRAVQRPTVHDVQTFPTGAHDSPAVTARRYLDGLRARLGVDTPVPRAGAFAVATAVSGDRIAFTNNHWDFSAAETAAALGLAPLLMLNDFGALAQALPHLRADQLRPWGGAGGAGALPAPQAGAGGSAPLAVVGPGTGLGVATLVPVGPRWVAVAGEGGHVTLPAGDDFEAELLAAVRRRHGHVSAERLLSGIGLPDLHQAVAAVLGQPAEGLGTPAIVARALDGSDALARQTLEHFCALLGSFAGNVALTVGARGGVYIGGGIVPRLGDLFFASRFRERFEAKGRFRDYLGAIPTALILDTESALVGAAAALAQWQSNGD